jgi:4'-phosphopantetheinyl transferase
VAALSTEGRVGIDVEPLRAVDLAGMDAYMNPEQWRTISASADAAAVFLDLWTVKESVVKCDGTGLSLPVREIDVQGDKAQLGEQMWHVRRLHVASGYACALASPLAIAQVALSHWQT